MEQELDYRTDHQPLELSSVTRKMVQVIFLCTIGFVTRAETAHVRVIERGAHYRVCLNDSGGRYTELRDGMNYLENGVWRETQEEFVSSNDGIVAANGYYKAKLRNNLAAGPVQVITPDGKLLTSSVRSIRYADTISGKSKVLGTVRDSVAQIISPNRVIYRSAFTGLEADVLVTYTSGALESDVILRQRPPPPEFFGLSAKSTQIQVESTWDDPPFAQVDSHLLRGQAGMSRRDSVVDFGEMRLWYGTAYAVSGDHFDMAPEIGKRAIQVAKRWSQEARTATLIEGTSYSECEPILQTLDPRGPPVDRPGRFNLNLSADRPGLVIDYILVTSGSSYTFQNGQTYLVSSSAGFSGPVVFQGGAVIKFNRGAFLYPYARVSNSISCQDGDLPVIFTAVDDNTVGEVISGSPVSGQYAGEALWIYYPDASLTISRCDFRYAQIALRCDANVTVTYSVNNCRFQDSGTGIYNQWGTPKVNAVNPIMCNVTRPIQGSSISLQGTITGCIPIGSTSIGVTFNNVSPGATLSGVVAVQTSASGPNPMAGGRLYVDGKEVDVDGNNSGNGANSFSLDTTTFANGSHTLTVAAEDNGEIGTTGDDDTVRDATPMNGVRSISVTFNNFLSHATALYPDFLPGGGRVQHIYATWSSSRWWQLDITADGNPGAVYKSFSGSGTSFDQTWDGNDSVGQPVPNSVVNYVYYDRGPSTGSPQTPTVIKNMRNAIGQIGTFCVLFQGHHPSRLYPNFHSAWPTPGGITFYVSHFNTGPWGRLAAPSSIAYQLASAFPNYGYYGSARDPKGYRGDDNLSTLDLTAASLGGSGSLDNVDLGLFIGHSAQCRETIFTLGYAQSYIPVYNKATDTVSWVGEDSMYFGGPTLKWLAFYSCNIFRDDIYRTGGSYFNMKYNNSGTALPINNDLHICQGYATEASLSPLMGAVWLRALTGQTPDSTAWTVVGAWKRVCRKTQPQNESVNYENVSRSVYWPECAGDYITGYGPSTDPDPFNTQDMLVEQDDFATP